MAVFTGNDEGLNHLRLFEVAVELIELRQPEREALAVRIPAQVAEVFHHHKRFVELRGYETIVFSDTPQHLGPVHRARTQTTLQTHRVQPAFACGGLTPQCSTRLNSRQAATSRSRPKR